MATLGLPQQLSDDELDRRIHGVRVVPEQDGIRFRIRILTGPVESSVSNDPSAADYDRERFWAVRDVLVAENDWPFGEGGIDPELDASGRWRHRPVENKGEPISTTISRDREDRF